MPALTSQSLLALAPTARTLQGIRKSRCSGKSLGTHPNCDDLISLELLCARAHVTKQPQLMTASLRFPISLRLIEGEFTGAERFQSWQISFISLTNSDCGGCLDSSVEKEPESLCEARSQEASAV